MLIETKDSSVQMSSFFLFFNILIVDINIYKNVNSAAWNTVNNLFSWWKFCEKWQFPHSLGWIARNYAETVALHKIFTSLKVVETTVFYGV